MRLQFTFALTVGIVMLAIATPAAQVPQWRLAQSEHFEVYAQASEQRAAAILQNFESLRAFFLTGSDWKSAGLRPVRVVVFASTEEYQPYRLRDNADAYYVGSGDQDYIVMADGDPQAFGIAAHEYVHLILRASNMHLPLWLREGLAELYATLRIGNRGTELGGPLPVHLGTLRKHPWMSLAELTVFSDDALQHDAHAGVELFYAQSWALTGMLALSPSYASSFPHFLAATRDESPGLQALTQSYGKSAGEIARDLQTWVRQGASLPVYLPPVSAESAGVKISDVSSISARLVLAQLLPAAGEVGRAWTLVSTLAHEAPNSAEVSAELATIALRKGDLSAAQSAWKHATELGIADGMACYRYASQADDAGVSPDEVRPALERAIALQPKLDDAHYRLAMIEKNAGHYEAAIQQFQAMQSAPDKRAYAYWIILANTFNELGRREEAQSAAEHAVRYAKTPTERQSAEKEAYIAQTDTSVQFDRDSNGHLTLVTKRIPHGTADWNPFVEPGDDIHRVQGELREIDCSRNVTLMRIDTAAATVTLAIPDLGHVQIRDSPGDFVCGQQTASRVVVDYARTPGAAADGILRGLGFQ